MKLKEKWTISLTLFFLYTFLEKEFVFFLIREFLSSLRFLLSPLSSPFQSSPIFFSFCIRLPPVSVILSCLLSKITKYWPISFGRNPSILAWNWKCCRSKPYRISSPWSEDQQNRPFGNCQKNSDFSPTFIGILLNNHFLSLSGKKWLKKGKGKIQFAERIK